MRFKQKHPETCLAKCLMILIEKAKNKKLADSYELKLLIYSLKHRRENIAKGHLEKFVKDFNINVNWYVGSKIFFDFTKKTKLAKQISLMNKRVDLELVDKLIQKPIIVCIDRFYLWKKGSDLYYKYHYPHFVVINKKLGNFYEIIDPDDGKVKKIEAGVISKAITSLKNRLWMCPQIIQVSA